ncbi:MAG: KH domain-containing protein [Candidatus Methylacidiphilales bacterium]
MKYFVEFVVSALVDKPDEVQIEESGDSSRTTLNIEVNPGDVGRVIGKKGRTIQAIRNIVGAAAQIKNCTMLVEIRDR